MIQIRKKQLEEKFTLKCIGKKIWNVLFHLLRCSIDPWTLLRSFVSTIIYVEHGLFSPASEALVHFCYLGA